MESFMEGVEKEKDGKGGYVQYGELARRSK